MGGAILSIDSMTPTKAWLWASPTWEKNVKTEVSNFLNGVHIQSKDPESMMRSWERALGKEAIFQDNQFQIQLEESRIALVTTSGGYVDGTEPFTDNDLSFRMIPSETSSIFPDTKTITVLNCAPLKSNGISDMFSRILFT